ncbi:MAG: SIS domain-containing protein [Minisyncoccia bacterium]
MTHNQFMFEQNVERPLSESAPVQIIAGGMGGSASAAMALAYLGAVPEVIVHETYDLPKRAPGDALYLAVSYSGSTEETLSFAEAVMQKNLPLAAVTSGGALTDFARKNALPLSLVPTSLVPRNALPEMLAAELALLGKTELLSELPDAIPSADSIGNEASALAEALRDRTPIFYCSERNVLPARIGKMFWNETAKLPAFVSIVPARNHEELQGFDPSGGMNGRFCVVLIRDVEDDERVSRRLSVIEALLPEMHLPVFSIDLKGATPLERLIRFWRLVHEAAKSAAALRGVDPDTNPITDEFKTRLARQH